MLKHDYCYPYLIEVYYSDCWTDADDTHFSHTSRSSTSFQGPWVVGEVDNAIHWINLYPVDIAIGFPNIYPLDSNLSGG